MIKVNNKMQRYWNFKTLHMEFHILNSFNKQEAEEKIQLQYTVKFYRLKKPFLWLLLFLNPQYYVNKIKRVVRCRVG